MSDETAAIDLDVVRAQIADEVRRLRTSGEVDARKERELEQLFSSLVGPHEGRDDPLSQVLRDVDATSFVNPIVPTLSSRPAGVAVKKTIRKAGLWYVAWLAAQMTAGLSSVATALHAIDDQLTEITRKLEVVSADDAAVIELDDASDPSAWWVSQVVEKLDGAPGRVLVAACGTGWLVGALRDRGVDAYGIDPRVDRILDAELAGLDLRDESLLAHLERVTDQRLHGVVLTGTTECLSPSQRRRLLSQLDRVLDPEGVVLIHALDPDRMDPSDLPIELDLSGTRPLRAATWVHALRELDFDAEFTSSPVGAGLVVSAARHPRA